MLATKGGVGSNNGTRYQYDVKAGMGAVLARLVVRDGSEVPIEPPVLLRLNSLATSRRSSAKASLTSY